MKALTILKSAINQSSFVGIIALISLVPVILPHYALAAELQTSGQTAQVFEIKITDPSLLDSTPKPNNTKSSLPIQALIDSDPLVIALKQYLDKNDSPLGIYAGQIILQPQWQRALAISFVESHMGRDCFNNNCSGMGGAPGTPTWRKYATKLDWFVDLNNLLEKPIYKEKYNTFQKMKGVYVQPGSPAWVNGAQRKYNDLMAITDQANVQRMTAALSQPKLLANVQTFPSNLAD